LLLLTPAPPPPPKLLAPGSDLPPNHPLYHEQRAEHLEALVVSGDGELSL